MEICLLVVLPVLLIPAASSGECSKTKDNSAQHCAGLTDQQFKVLLETQKQILEEIQNKRFFEYVEIEMYDNGAIKKITKRTDWQVIATLGITVPLGIGGAVYIYVINPAIFHVIAKHAEQFKPILLPMVKYISIGA